MLDNLDAIKRNVGDEPVENHLKAFRRNFNNYFKLSERYATGDRNKEMLLEYVRLLSAFYKGRVYEVRDELFNQPSDRERRDPHFWDLYNLAGLASTDSPAFDYLLKNRKRFDRTIGKDKVNKLIERVQSDGTI